MLKQNDDGNKYRRKIYDSYISHRIDHQSQSWTTPAYKQWAAAAAVRVRNWLPENTDAPILDIGCGAGQFLHWLEQLGYTNLIGVDLSPEQVSLARQMCSRARIIQGDAFHVLADYSGHFALIAGFDVIEHLQKVEAMQIVPLIERALQPRGRIILQTPNPASPLAGTILYGDLTHEWFYTPESLGNMLRLYGFADYVARPSAPYPHGVKSALRTFLWKLIEVAWRFCNVVETGSGGTGIYSRVFIASAIKPIHRASSH